MLSRDLFDNPDHHRNEYSDDDEWMSIRANKTEPEDDGVKVNNVRMDEIEPDDELSIDELDEDFDSEDDDF